ncbi:hypothetical protein [Streptomyces alboflavus]|uniref:hypothetical protein n=1 Tax=Streptomyces alboflavus TaxID=67267 RepID=UPI001877C4F3|nr:hypothetical protein [Streptomyces alboflavus]
MSTYSDQLESEIDAWVAAHLATAPNWTEERCGKLWGMLGDQRGIEAGQSAADRPL